MKFTLFYAFLFLATCFTIGHNTSLEAKHHTRFSINFHPQVHHPVTPYVVERYPAYVEERVYIQSYAQPYAQPYGYPVYQERVYVQPAPRAYYVAPQRPTFYSGFSFGFGR